ncbi:hypothetical protein RRG08_030788 [Elysia crispata]|uniref:Uncharacterized protein n=1 Tax=Elysia crispata TaxID=231223 RepID=A0AAE0YF87_9GAST|nr:hypothetical protein RRG08_030788 [Elysia crispata]
MDERPCLIPNAHTLDLKIQENFDLQPRQEGLIGRDAEIDHSRLDYQEGHGMTASTSNKLVRRTHLTYWAAELVKIEMDGREKIWR